MTVTCALFDNNKIFSTICRFPQLKHGKTLQPGHTPSTACSFYANKSLLLIYSNSRESHRLISSSRFQKRWPMCNKLITLQFSANENNYFPSTMIVVRKIFWTCLWTFVDFTLNFEILNSHHVISQSTQFWKWIQSASSLYIELKLQSALTWHHNRPTPGLEYPLVPEDNAWKRKKKHWLSFTSAGQLITTPYII